MKAKLLGNMSLLSELQSYDISNMKPDMSKKAKVAMKDLIKSLGNLEGAELN